MSHARECKFRFSFAAKKCGSLLHRRKVSSSIYNIFLSFSSYLWVLYEVRNSLPFNPLLLHHLWDGRANHHISRFSRSTATTTRFALLLAGQERERKEGHLYLSRSSIPGHIRRTGWCGDGGCGERGGLNSESSRKWTSLFPRQSPKYTLGEGGEMADIDNHAMGWKKVDFYELECHLCVCLGLLRARGFVPFWFDSNRRGEKWPNERRTSSIHNSEMEKGSKNRLLMAHLLLCAHITHTHIR